MLLDSDVALLGTGVAPLVAANYFLAHGKSVLLLNPDLDYFLEESELPFDPLLHSTPTPARLLGNSPESALAALRPDFPGAIEYSSPASSKLGFHDLSAPHVRQRGRLWLSTLEKNRFWSWEKLEDLYVEASDASLNPQILEGLSATRKFPGHASHQGNYRALYIPKLYDVDTIRYRLGLLEFLRERVKPNQMICAVNQIEKIPDGIRFHAQGLTHTAKLTSGLLVFWTPRLSSWILGQLRKNEAKNENSIHFPSGIRLWEEWFLNSREELDPHTIGMLGDLAVWAEVEGDPSAQNSFPLLGVLRSGPLIPLDHIQIPQGGLTWASSESFEALSRLCHPVMRWDRCSIRKMRVRTLFEWPNPTQPTQNQSPAQPWILSETNPHIRVIPGCDGPLVDIVRNSRMACDPLLEEA